MARQHPRRQLTGPISRTHNQMPAEHSRPVIPLQTSLAAATHQQASLAAAFPQPASLAATRQLASLAVQQQGRTRLRLAAARQLASLVATLSSRSSSGAGGLRLVVLQEHLQRPTHLPKADIPNRCVL